MELGIIWRVTHVTAREAGQIARNCGSCSPADSECPSESAETDSQIAVPGPERRFGGSGRSLPGAAFSAAPDLRCEVRELGSLKRAGQEAIGELSSAGKRLARKE